MKRTPVTSSYGVRLLGINRMLMETIHIYQDAVCYLCDCVNDMWADVSPVKGSNTRMTYVERKVHAAGDRVPLYDFDVRFPNMPSYMRREAIHAAIGSVSSYRSSYAGWQKAGSHGRPPKLGRRTSKAPVFYRSNMYKQIDADTAELKLYDGSNWVWVKVRLRMQDVKYLQKHWSHAEKSAPRLELKRGKARLVFACTEKVLLSDNAAAVVGCDLGINTDATLCAMRPDGTVFARKFIDFADDKGRLYHLMGIASYNIAARYYMRLLVEPLPVTARSYIEAKVPGCMVRTTRTLSTLINCFAALQEFASSDAEIQPYG